MASQGKGISDAVRGAIREWLNEDSLSEIRRALDFGSGLAPFDRWDLRDAKAWVRRSRSINRAGTGYIREYQCKNDDRIGLQVHTNSADTRINFVMFRVKGKLVGGGYVDVPSVFEENQWNRDTTFRSGGRATLKSATFPARYGAEAKAVKTFVPFKKKDLEKIEAQISGGGDVMLMLQERDY